MDKMNFFEALTPGILGGILIGIFAGIPILNLFLPLFAVGGYFAAKFFEVLNEREVEVGEAGYVGFLAGFFGSIFGGGITLIIASFFVEQFFSFSKFFGEYGNIIMLLSGFDLGVNLITLRNRFLFNVISCSVLGAIGGAIYSKSKKRVEK